MVEIDINKNYKINDYEYINYVNLTIQQKENVLEWRNRDEVRLWMFNSEKITLSNHLFFIEGLKTRQDAFYWLVLKNGQPIGCYNLTNIDYNKSITENGIFFVDIDFFKMKDNWDLFVNTILFTFSLGFNLIEGHTAKNNKYVIMMNTCTGYSDSSEGKDIYTNHKLSKELFYQRLKEGLSYKDFRKFSKDYIRKQKNLFQ